MKRTSSIPDSPFKVRMREGARRILRLFGGCSNRDVEYDFAYRNVVGKQLHILDIGGCDSLLPTAFAKAGHMVTVYDLRSYSEDHPNLTVIQGDFLHNELPGNSFDMVVMVSTIEHVGLGGYGAPEYPDADFEIAKELRRVLVDGGKVVLTFPFNGEERVIPHYERWYTPERLQQLFDGWFVLDVEFWVGEKKLLGRWVSWRPATMQEAVQAYEGIGVQGVACFTLSNRSLDWWER